MRALTDHEGSAANNKISVVDFNNIYGNQPNKFYSASYVDVKGNMAYTPITFHTGNPSEGINGITDEVLLAIVIDRLKGWQEGPHKCRENALAQTHIETGLMWMQKRTRERQARGVEGTQEV